MPRVKVPRKSTNVDMTAMCDVAFLLLAFFILCAHFKPAEALAVQTPSSVASRIAPDQNIVQITIDSAGKVYLSVSDKNAPEKQTMIDEINTTKALNLTDGEKNNFVKQPAAYIGVPFTQLKSYLDRTPDQLKGVVLPGIPVKDSTDNDLITWMHAAATAFEGSKMNILVKGDNASLYPSFQGVIIAFKKNDQMKFQLVTDPVAAPHGSELEKVLQAKPGSKIVD
jgi:biopolymer transport protein ExbD